MVPLRDGANSNGYKTDAEIDYQFVRNLRTIGTMFVLEKRNQAQDGIRVGRPGRP